MHEGSMLSILQGWPMLLLGLFCCLSLLYFKLMCDGSVGYDCLFSHVQGDMKLSFYDISMWLLGAFVLFVSFGVFYIGFSDIAGLDAGFSVVGGFVAFFWLLALLVVSVNAGHKDGVYNTAPILCPECKQRNVPEASYCCRCTYKFKSFDDKIYRKDF